MSNPIDLEGDLQTVLKVTCCEGDLFVVAETGLSRQLGLPVGEPVFEDELPAYALLLIETNPDSIAAAFADLSAQMRLVGVGGVSVTSIFLVSTI